jgi:hypothetical protein
MMTASEMMSIKSMSMTVGGKSIITKTTAPTMASPMPASLNLIRSHPYANNRSPMIILKPIQ